MLNITNQPATAVLDDDSLEPFIIQVPVVSTKYLGKEIKEIFTANTEIEGIAVIDNDVPQGIIMRTTFFQKLGSLYGNSLFMERSIKMLMDKEMMTADVNDTVSSIGVKAMSRPQSRLYDYVVVLKNKAYIGVISIRQFLIELSKRNEAQIEVLQQQKNKLTEAHEQEVELRNSLISKSNTVKNLLDHAGQGFLLFGASYIIKSELSVECSKIFKKQISGENYISLICNYFAAEKKQVFTAAFEGYFSNNSPVTDNVYLMLLPGEAIIEGKYIHFEYKRIENTGEKSVMVILNDITEQKELQSAMQEEQNTKHLVIKSLTYQTQIRQMLREFKELFASGYKSFFNGQPDIKVPLNELYRAVHTFKGDFAQYGFIHSSEQLHKFEDKLNVLVNSDGVQENDIEDVMSGLDSDEIVKQDLSIIENVLGESFFEANDSITVSNDMFSQLENAVLNGQETYNKNEIYQMLQSLKRKNIKYFLNQYGDYLQYLSERLLKNMPVYIVEGDDVYIDPALYGDLIRNLVHIYRNMMDHGIETDEDRLANGKTEQGVIICQIKKTIDNQFLLCISDDGSGIDTEKLLSKAKASGLFTAAQLEGMTEQEIINLIFLEHFSTKEKADSLSGRGVGMPAVRSACEKLGGRLEVTSQRGKGSTFTFMLPQVI